MPAKKGRHAYTLLGRNTGGGNDRDKDVRGDTKDQSAGL